MHTWVFNFFFNYKWDGKHVICHIFLNHLQPDCKMWWKPGQLTGVAFVKRWGTIIAEEAQLRSLELWLLLQVESFSLRKPRILTNVQLFTERFSVWIFSSSISGCKFAVILNVRKYSTDVAVAPIILNDSVFFYMINETVEFLSYLSNIISILYIMFERSN